MSRSISALLRHLAPAMAREDAGEILRAASGALLGLLACAALFALLPGPDGPALYLFAPLGATAVLVFAVPNSPLAQPWSAIAGNMVSALVAVAVLQVLPAPWSAGIAVGGAIAAMMLVRALHPPGGAVALLAVLDAEATQAAGWWFPVLPVGLATAALVLCAVLHNRATGRAYPLRLLPWPEPAAPRLALTRDVLEGLLAKFHQSANLGAADLGRLLAAAEVEAARHRFDALTCGDLAHEALITVTPATPLRQLAVLFRDNPIKSLPVIDRGGAFLGIVRQLDLMPSLAARGPVRQKTARQVMRPPHDVVAHDMPVGHLLNRMARREVQVVPVTKEDRLIGIITRSDILALLWRATGGAAGQSPVSQSRTAAACGDSGSEADQTR